MVFSMITDMHHEAVRETRTPAGFRTQPHNIEAEQALLGAILINNEAYHRVSEYRGQSISTNPFMVESSPR
jgi:hypothetical protein